MNDPVVYDKANDLLDREFVGELGGPELYYAWDGALDDTTLNDEGNAFTQAYFDFADGRYVHDYVSTLAHGLPTEFHVDDSWENYDRASAMISERYAQWKAGKSVSAHPWWKFWA